ncbi:MAG: hypothetical protein AAGI08_03310, partial [Bacteroidota bacterium]
VRFDVLAQGGAVLKTVEANQSADDSVLNLSDIDAAQHPFIKLRAVLTDTTRTSTPQLDRWYATYESVPELVLDPATFKVSADSLQEGELVTLTGTLTNISPYAAGEVTITYQITDQDNVTQTVGVDTLSAFDAYADAGFDLEVNTLGLAGPYIVQVDARQSGGAAEPLAYNNTAFSRFFVYKDNAAPTYSITIDGTAYPSDPRVIRTTTDESLPFINSRPTIEVVLRDENPYLALSDTSFVTMELDGEKLSFSRPDVQFVPGTLEKNEARVIFTPEFRRDTTHTLILYAEDASGNSNPTFDEPYQVNFRVSPNPSVSTLYPYPNPMNTRTTFAFRLLGADPGLVDDFRIRIYTINGRLIREFDLVEDPSTLDGGALRIGWNKVDWDGTDQDGDLIANGVYLYKVFLRADGKELEVNNDSGIEKLVVIR